MKKQKIVIGVLLLIAILSFSSLAMGMTPSGPRLSGNTAELDDIDLSASGFIFGPGSSVPLYDPQSSSYEHLIWGSDIEPVEVTWTIYNPYMHEIAKITHIPSIKKQGTFTFDNGETYQWVFADATAFTIPAFASKGTWLASPSYKMADGSIQNGAYQFYTFDVTRDDVLASIFIAPWFLFGFQMPSLFFFPLGVIWLPLAYLGICMLFPKTIGHFVDYTKKLVDAGRKAKRGWRKKSKA